MFAHFRGCPIQLLDGVRQVSPLTGGAPQIYILAAGRVQWVPRGSSYCEVDSMKMRGNGRSLGVMVCVLAALGWMGARSALGQEALSKAELISADTAKVSPGGATFTVPAGWSLESGKDLVVLTPPETDTHVAIFDAGGAADAKVAVTEAWAAYKGKETHPVKLVTPRPAREGWD